MIKVIVKILLIYFAVAQALAIAADFNGDGTDDVSIFRPSMGLWAIRGITRCYFGAKTDVPSVGDYNGNGSSDIAVFRPTNGLWAIRSLSRVYFGSSRDIPLIGTGINYNPEYFYVDSSDGIVKIGWNSYTSGLEVGRAMESSPSEWPNGIGHDVTFYSTYCDGDGRFVWDQDKTALRVNKYPIASDWDTEPGYCSISSGYQSLALGNSSAAFGERAIASGGCSLAAGLYSFASGDNSICMGGWYGYATATNSIAIGEFVRADADNAIVIGRGAGDIFSYLTNDNPNSLMVGFNTSTDPALFVDSTGVGIGITSPARKLHVKDVLRLEPRNLAPSNPSEGDLYYDSATHKLKCYNGSGWQDCF